MTREALGVLRVGLVAVDVAVAHGLLRGVAIHAVQLPFAARELADGLVIFGQAARGGVSIGRGRQVGARDEGHPRQVVVAAVVAVIALAVRHGGGQLMRARVTRFRAGDAGIAPPVQPVGVV